MADNFIRGKRSKIKGIYDDKMTVKEKMVLEREIYMNNNYDDDILYGCPVNYELEKCSSNEYGFTCETCIHKPHNN
jgi:hypothetical protein